MIGACQSSHFRPAGSNGRGAGRRDHQRPHHRRQRDGDRLADDRRPRRKDRVRRCRRAGENVRGCKMIDAKGMTRACPATSTRTATSTPGPNEKAQMQALLEAGYTTILSGGGPADGNITLRDHIEKGVINGPRIIPSGRIALRDNTPDKRAPTSARWPRWASSSPARSR